ncbi:hypothetical protein LXL04_034508 [Taraxacum kok-saghyz]
MKLEASLKLEAVVELISYKHGLDMIEKIFPPYRTISLHIYSEINSYFLVYESDDTCLQQLRMNRTAFFKLCRMLEIDGKLKASRYLQIDEQVAIFLHVLAHHVKNRVVKFPFRRSGETISKHFNNVVNVVIRLEQKLFKKP